MKKRRGTPEAPSTPPAGQGDLFGGSTRDPVPSPGVPEPAPRPPPPTPLPPAQLPDVSAALSSLPGAPARPAPTRTVLSVGERGDRPGIRFALAPLP